MGGAARGLAVFAVALGARLLYLWQSADSPTALTPIVDAAGYHEIAARWAEGKGVPRDLFWQSPFYPAFLAAVYRALGVSVEAARLVQAVIGAATALLAGRLAAALYGGGAGLAAGLAVALCGPLVFFDGELVGAGLAAFWGIALILLLLRTERVRRPAAIAAWGAAAAAAALTRAEFLPFALVATLWLLWRVRGAGWRRPAATALLAAAGALAVIAPFGWLSVRAAGKLVLAPASGGLNLYLGNNPKRCETLAIRPGWAWDRLIQEPLGAGGGEAFANGGHFSQRALTYLVEDPAGFAAGLGAKAIDFLSSRETPRNVDPYLYRHWSPLLAALLWERAGLGFPFGLLFPLALLGAALCWGRTPPPVWLFLLLYPAAVILVFPAARYRAPILPVLAVLAAGGAVAFAAVVAARDRRRLAAGCAALAAGVAFSWLPAPSCPDRGGWEAELYTLAGLARLARGDAAAGERYLERAMALDPRNAEAMNGLANLRLGQRRTEEARALFARAESTGVALEVTRNNVGNLLAAEGRLGEARASFAAALRANPLYPPAHNNLGVLLSRSGQPGAELFLREALRLAPGYEEARNNLGNVLAREGRRAEAEATFRELLRRNPGHATAHYNLAVLLRRRGRTGEARDHAAAALRLEPGLVAARELMRAIDAAGDGGESGADAR